MAPALDDDTRASVERMLRKLSFVITGRYDEDLIQDGWVAALAVLPRWNPAIAPFGGFAYLRCRGAMIEAVRRRPLPGPTTLDDVVLLGLGPTVEDDCTVEERDLLVRAMRRLDDRHLGVLVDAFYREETHKEIGARFGVTESRVSQLIAEAGRRCRGGNYSERHRNPKENMP